MITAIFIDRKGFMRAEVLPRPEPTYRFYEYRPQILDVALRPDEPLTTKVVSFRRDGRVAEDIYEYREV